MFALTVRCGCQPATAEKGGGGARNSLVSYRRHSAGGFMGPSLRMVRKRSPCAEMTTNGEYITRCHVEPTRAPADERSTSVLEMLVGT